MATIPVYAKFKCGICGETVYSPVVAEEPGKIARQSALFELTCSNGHTDCYDQQEVQIVQTRQAGVPKVRYAFAD